MFTSLLRVTSRQVCVGVVVKWMIQHTVLHAFFRVVCLFNGLILYIFPPISQGHNYSVQSVRQPHIALVLKMLVLLRQLAALYKLYTSYFM